MSHLYKKFVNEQIAPMTSDLKAIRNCTVIAHVDHGKTTLTDSLIAASGLLSNEVAASARLLDSDLIEQERGITIKASGISLIHRSGEQAYLIHLVDTPGHIDFSSHVTRGLRMTDGAIVVVDVVEGIMVQTETVTRQALNELVRPVLFINKIDRLINERRLTTQKIAIEVNKVVREFNAMLGKYLPDELLRQWEVSLSRRSVVIGSALDKWGVDLDVLVERSDVTNDSPQHLATVFIELLNDIASSYEHGQEKELAKRYPLARAIFESVVHNVPSPDIAQGYRIPRMWNGDKSSAVGRGLLTCSTNAPCVLIVGNVQPDRHAGISASVRVMSGILRRSMTLRNIRTGRTGRPLQVGIFMSKTRIPLDSIPAGNLAFITGVGDLLIGDTLVDDSVDEMPPLSRLQLPIEPVVTYTIEPRVLSELSTIEQPIREFVATDPSLEFTVNTDTGEMLLSGVGELQIEIAVERLAREGIMVELRRPVVLLKEQMTRDGIVAEACGGETGSRFRVRAVLTAEDLSLSEEGTILASVPHSGCYLVDKTGHIPPHDDTTPWIVEAFTTVVMAGPLRGERMRRLTLCIEDAEVRTESPETSWRDVTQPLLSAIRSSIMSGEPALMEPWMHLEINTPEEYVGSVTSILMRRKGRIFEINTIQNLYRIEAELPVRESFGLATELRTATSGWATWGVRAGLYHRVHD